MRRSPILSTFFVIAVLASAAAWNFGLPRPPERAESAPVARTAPIQSAPALAALPAPASPLSAADEVSLPNGFADEAAALGRLTNNPADDEARLTALAAKLDADSARGLRNLALNGDRPHNDRFLAAYLLGLRAEDFAGDLEAIAAADSPGLRRRPHPHTFSEANWHFEISLRVTALAALDRNPDRAHAAAFFRKVESSHSNETVRKVARVGRVGAEKNEALIDSYLTAKAEGALRDVTQD